MRIGPHAVIWAPNASEAVKRALKDLARDWRRVLATRPEISWAPVPPDSITIAVAGDLKRGQRQSNSMLGTEEFKVCVNDHGVVCIDGGDDRGLIYGIYAFSEEVLGIHPMWFWNEAQPVSQEELDVTELHLVSNSPAFTWRGWFINDEDLLTGWAPSPRPGEGISLLVWDRICESLLRCRGNFIVPGTFIFPSEPQLDLAARRGLAIGQHHAEPLGVNAFKWPQEVPYSFVESPATFIDLWKRSIRAQDGRDVLWSVGYRGRHDRPFWLDEPDSHAAFERRAEHMSRAIAVQTQLIRDIRPRDLIVVNVWMEQLEVFRSGGLELPGEVVVVMPDDGHGKLPLDLTGCRGIYYHVAMHDRVASQLSEMVPPRLISAEIARACESGATDYFLLNVSDIKPAMLTTHLSMAAAWRGSIDADAELYRWCEAAVGATHAHRLALLWERYFKAGWRYHEDSPYRLEDNAYQTFARGLLRAAADGLLHEQFEYTDFADHFPPPYQLLGPLTGIELAQVLKAGTAEAAPVWARLDEDVTEFIEQLDVELRPAQASHIGLQVRVHALSNLMLHECAASVYALALGESSEAVERLDRAAHHTQDLMRTLVDSETGKWQDWHLGEVFLNPAATLQQIQGLRDLIEGRSSVLPDLPGENYDYIKKYQDGLLVDLGKEPKHGS